MDMIVKIFPWLVNFIVFVAMLGVLESAGATKLQWHHWQHWAFLTLLGLYAFTFGVIT